MTTTTEPISRQLALETTGPFNLPVTVRLLQRRPANGIDHLDDQQRYRRVFETADGPRLVGVENRGTVTRPDLMLDVLGGDITPATEKELVATIRWMLGLDTEPAPTGWLAEQEPGFQPVTRAITGFRAPAFPTLFEASARVLPFQQLSLDAGSAITLRMVERFGTASHFHGQEWRAFPAPQVIADADIDQLRETGLSRAKATALRTLAERALNGELDLQQLRVLPTAEVLKKLEALPGIGPWSARVIALRGLRRLEIFPTGDVGAARNLPQMLGLSERWTPDDACAYAERFGDRRGYLYFLGLGAQLIGRGLIDPAQSDLVSEKTAGET